MEAFWRLRSFAGSAGSYAPMRREPNVNRRARLLAATPRLIARSAAATRHAARAGAPGIQFARFGRMPGLKALAFGDRSAFALLVTPVSMVRYWEFLFVLRHLPQHPDSCLEYWGSPFVPTGCPRSPQAAHDAGCRPSSRSSHSHGSATSRRQLATCPEKRTDTQPKVGNGPSSARLHRRSGRGVQNHHEQRWSQDEANR